MTDARLRSLERAAAAGDVEAQARQLAERVRAGTLTRERLELAAYCGDAGAATAAGWTVSEAGAPWPGVEVHHTRGWRANFEGALEEWAEGLDRWGTAVLVRASLAAGEAAYQVPGAVHRSDDGLPDPALQVIVAARRWLGRPDKAHEAIWRIISRSDGVPLWAPTVWTQALHNDHGEPAWSRSARDCVTQARLTAGEGPTREAITRALIAWALGPAPAPPALEPGAGS